MMKQQLFRNLVVVFGAALVNAIPSLAQSYLNLTSRGPQKKVISSNRGKNGFVLRGNVEGVNGKIYMVEAGIPNAEVLDSTMAVNGRFVFKGTLTSPVMVTLVQPDRINFSPIFIENGEMMVYGRANNREINVYGSITDQKYRDRNRQVNELVEQYITNRSMMSELPSEISRFNMDFIEKNLDCVVSAYVLLTEFVNSLPLQAIKYKLESFSEEVKKSPYVRELKNYVDRVEATSVGKKFIDVQLPDLNGKIQKLSELIGNGKYILLNFWASWCLPCRETNEELARIYREFSSLGFDIYNVAMDRNYDEWVNAVGRYGVCGTNVSNLKSWNCPAARSYGVNVAPMMLLIDPQGIIIERGMDISLLRVKLGQIFRRSLSSLIN
jgi:thiol-disulfide isomerase/thioredoxin